MDRKFHSIFNIFLSEEPLYAFLHKNVCRFEVAKVLFAFIQVLSRIFVIGSSVVKLRPRLTSPAQLAHFSHRNEAAENMNSDMTIVVTSLMAFDAFVWPIF